jgi:hypothetical protein
MDSIAGRGIGRIGTREEGREQGGLTIDGEMI